MRNSSNSMVSWLNVILEVVIVFQSPWQGFLFPQVTWSWEFWHTTDQKTPLLLPLIVQIGSKRCKNTPKKVESAQIDTILSSWHNLVGTRVPRIIRPEIGRSGHSILYGSDSRLVGCWPGLRTSVRGAAWSGAASAPLMQLLPECQTGIPPPDLNSVQVNTHLELLLAVYSRVQGIIYSKVVQIPDLAGK
jgi:hypothetical protein